MRKVDEEFTARCSECNTQRLSFNGIMPDHGNPGVSQLDESEWATEERRRCSGVGKPVFGYPKRDENRPQTPEEIENYIAWKIVVQAGAENRIACWVVEALADHRKRESFREALKDPAIAALLGVGLLPW